MNANPLVCVFLLLVTTVIQLPAAQGTDYALIPPSDPYSTPQLSGTNSVTTNSIFAFAEAAFKEAALETNAMSKSNLISVAQTLQSNADEFLKTNTFFAEERFEHAAMHGDVSAQEWCLKTAENGDADMQCFVGQLYDFGFMAANVRAEDYLDSTQTNYPENPNEAVKWYERAAAQGNADAQNNLGAHYASGEGVVMDYVEAYKWLNLAAASSDPSGTAGAFSRDKIAEQMTPDQIAEAQGMSRDFKPRTELNSSNSTSPGNPTASGTGFFITDDGYLISNYHVVRDATQIRVVTSSGIIPASVVQVDTVNDIALLKVEGSFSALPIAASRTVSLGETVATIGFPDPGLQGFSPKLAKGEIAALAGAMDDPNDFQISVPVQPGNSGGALVDEHGNVVGIVSAKLDATTALEASGALPENVNYAIKSSFLLGFLESVPDVSAKLKEPNTQDEKFEDVVESAQKAAVLVLVY
jgi:S1-C subfamily serine protease